MRKLIFFSILVIAIILLNNCSKTPVFPNTPQIELKSLQQSANKDSITITLKFKDGDGDLGLASDDINAPYNFEDFQTDNFGNYIIKDPTAPFDCNIYDTLDIDNNGITDTVLVKRNPNYYNYFIDFLIKQSDGTFKVFDFNCFGFNGRFPKLSSDKGPLEGDLSYLIDLSIADPIVYADNFENKDIKFRITIQDRSLNKSNTIETSELRFPPLP